MTFSDVVKQNTEEKYIKLISGEAESCTGKNKINSCSGYIEKKDAFYKRLADESKSIRDAIQTVKAVKKAADDAEAAERKKIADAEAAERKRIEDAEKERLRREQAERDRIRREQNRINFEKAEKRKKKIMLISAIAVVVVIILSIILGVSSCNRKKEEAARLEELNYGSAHISMSVLGKSNGSQSYNNYTTKFKIQINNDCGVDITYLTCDMIFTELNSGTELCNGSVWFSGDIAKGAKNKFDLELKTSTNDIWNYSLKDMKIQCKITGATFKDGTEKDYSLDYTTIYDGSAVHDPNDTSVFNMQLSSDGKYYIITEVQDQSRTIYNIPSTYNNKPVAAIGDNAFEDCALLTKIEIPNSIESIGENAFSGCYSLGFVSIPNSVTYIGRYAFSYCTNLIIYCETSTAPSGWHSYWDVIYYDAYNRHDIIWNYSGQQGVTVDGFEWYALNDGNAYLVSFNNKTSTNITVPSSIQGYSIKNIPDELFLGCSSISNVVVSNGIESIGKNAFTGCSSLKSITLPSSLKTIGESSFDGCVKLSNLVLPKGVLTIQSYAFADCKDLSNIVIPETVATLGSYVFENCENLTIYCEASEKQSGWDYKWNAIEYEYWESSLVYHPVVYNYSGDQGVTSDGLQWYATKEGNAVIFGVSNTSATTINIPVSISGYSVVEIPKGLLSACTSLRSLTIPFVGSGIDATQNTHFGYIFGASSYSYNGDYVPTSLKEVTILGGTKIAKNAFYNCSSLTNISIPESILKIGDNAFKNCNNLSFKTKEGLKYLGNTMNPYIYLFESTTIDISNATIESGCKYIAANALADCSKLTNVTLPASIIDIATDAFNNCSNLTNVYYNGDIGKWCNISFSTNKSNPMAYATNLYFNNNLVTSINIPNSVTAIGNYAFYNVDSITSLVISANVTYIGDYAFWDCDGFSNVTIPSKVTYLGDYAFYSCNTLTAVEISDTCKLETIGDYAFSSAKITSITIPENVSHIGIGAFKSCSKLTEIIFKNPNGWNRCYSETSSGTEISSREMGTPSQAASYLTYYYDYYWIQK